MLFVYCNYQLLLPATREGKKTTTIKLPTTTNCCTNSAVTNNGTTSKSQDSSLYIYIYLLFCVPGPLLYLNTYRQQGTNRIREKGLENSTKKKVRFVTSQTQTHTVDSSRLKPNPLFL